MRIEELVTQTTSAVLFHAIEKCVLTSLDAYARAVALDDAGRARIAAHLAVALSYHEPAVARSHRICIRLRRTHLASQEQRA